MGKKLLSIFLVVAMLISVVLSKDDIYAKDVNSVVNSYEIAMENNFNYVSDTNGKCGINLNWSYSNGTLYITGSGAMYDYPVYNVPASSQCMPWYNYKSSIRNINISDGVTSIGACAFYGCNALTSIVIPASIITIGYAAFADCTSLKTAEIKGGYIGESAFIRCSSLEKVVIESGVTGSGISAFENCTGIRGVYIDDMTAWCNMKFGGYLANPLQYAKHLYLNNSEVRELVIPEGITEIGNYVFEYGQSITSVSIPSSVKKIGDYAFYMCNAINTVNIPLFGLETIGASAFDSCSNLKNITFPETISYIGSSSFTWTPIDNVKVRQGIIEKQAFEGCGCIMTVELGKNVTFVGDSAFNRCAGLRNVNYDGSRAQWNMLSIGVNNDALKNANVNCSGTENATIHTLDSGMIHVGSLVKIGAYEQDNNMDNGSEPIEWIVLDVQGNNVLVISKDVLDFQRYYPNLQTSINWSNSYARSWLNDEFYNIAFTETQKSSIKVTDISSENNSYFGTLGGETTSDKIFLLSESEAKRYFKTDADRISNGTEYAVHRNGDSALRNNATQSSYWWLRTPGMFNYSTMYVHYTGFMSEDGMAAANIIGGIRPAMWVDSDTVELMMNTEQSSAAKIGRFVDRLYRTCLNRAPDSAGKEDWENRLANGWETGASVAYGFVFSDEFKCYNYCNQDYVKQLYRAFMGREYDIDGLNYWVNKLETGTIREEVFNGFSQSSEFKNICDDCNIVLGDRIIIPQYGTVPHGVCAVCGKVDGVTDFVTRLYNICLNRAPDTDGLNEWTNQLWTHKKSGKSVANGFIFSKEFENKGLNDEDYIECLYKAFFDRSSDEAGKNYWLDSMHNHGANREEVFNGFSGSSEFDALCKKYGILRED